MGQLVSRAGLSVPVADHTDPEGQHCQRETHVASYSEERFAR